MTVYKAIILFLTLASLGSINHLLFAEPAASPAREFKATSDQNKLSSNWQKTKKFLAKKKVQVGLVITTTSLILLSLLAHQQGWFKTVGPKPNTDEVGVFNDYAGADEVPYSTWFHSARAFPAISVMQGLDPDKAWMAKRYGFQRYRTQCLFHHEKCFVGPDGNGWIGSNLTKLVTPLAERTDVDTKISIDTTGKDKFITQGFGECRSCQISIGKLQEFSGSAKIVTDPDLITPDQFIADQKKYETEIDAGIDTEKMSKEMLKQAMGVCHSQQCMFFVEEHKGKDGKACNTLRTGNLSGATPIVMLSAAGINFSETGRDKLNAKQLKKTEKLINSMWKAVLAAAVAQGTEYICMPAIGMGAFLPTNHPHKNTIAMMYFEQLCQAMRELNLESKFKQIYFNPATYGAQLNTVLAKNPDLKKTIQNFASDVVLQAVNLSKDGTLCSLLNPSAAHVLWGRSDIGNHYKTLGYVAEEFMAAVSTAFVGSRFVSPAAWTDRRKVLSIDEAIKGEAL
jgi:hypothetical protein